MVSECGSRGLLSSLEGLMRFEQCNLWRPERFRDPAVRAEFAGGYLPEGRTIFRLPCFLIPRQHLYIYGDQKDASVGLADENGHGPRNSAVFPIHPGELEHYTGVLTSGGAWNAERHGLRLWATPTSSVRTVLAWPDGRPDRAFFAKLSLHSRLLGDRRLPRRKVASSVGLSHFVCECSSELPPGVHCLSEPFGLTPRTMPESGVLFRSIPKEVMDGSVVVAPLFALMGGNAENPPVLLQLMEKQRAGALEVLEEILLARFAKLWVDLVFDHGLILEAHAQDLLLALSPDLVPTGRFYYRDFEGLTVDWALRRVRRLREPELPHAFEWFSTYETWGHPRFQLVSNKMFISLFDYLHLMLAELETALREWQASGVVTSAKVREGELTFLFSRYLRQTIREKFGMSEAEEYDIHSKLNRFVKFLMQVRRAVLTDHP